MSRRQLRKLILVGLILGLTSPFQAQAEDTLVFGFLPILSPQKLVARFGPLADYISDQLGKPVRLETAANYTEFIHRTDQRRYDILFTAPHFYYLARQKAGYQVLARVNAPSLHAIIVTRTDSGINSLQDLRGKKLSTVDPLGLGTVLIKVHLKENNLDPDKDLTLVATPTHNASLLSAYKRITDAASLMLPPFKRASTEVKNNMKIIAETAGTPHMPISVSPSVSAEDTAVIERALLSMHQTDAGKALLMHMSWPSFASTDSAEYEQLEWAARYIHLMD